MRITTNKNGSLNFFGISLSKARALHKVLTLAKARENKGATLPIDLFELKLIGEFINDLEKEEVNLWK